MEDQRIRRIPLGAIAAVAAAAIAGGGGFAWWQVQSVPQVNDGPVPVTVETKPASPANNPAQGKTVQVYWLKTVDNRLELAPEQAKLDLSGQPNQDLKSVFTHLLAGPSATTNVTTIPPGTQLRSVSVEGNAVRVDLSQEFTSGGGSASMAGRVAQVLYTATSLQPTAKVFISVEGKTLEVLGGEGLMLDQPLTRQQFQQDFDL